MASVDTAPRHTTQIFESGRVRHFLPLKNEPGTQIRLDKRILHIDPAYQRKLNENRVRRFASSWNWIACGVLIVSKRPGREGYFVMDGQHRWAAAMLIDSIRDLPCLVFELDQTQDEALGFLATNTEHRAPTLRDQFNALLMADDPIAKKLAELAEKAHRTVGAPADKLHISCVGAIMRTIREDIDVIERVWPVIIDVARERPLQSRLVSGIYGLERRLISGSLTDTRNRERLMAIGNDALVREIANVCALEGTGGERQCAQGVMRAVNHGLRQKLRVDFEGFAQGRRGYQ